MKPLEKFKIGTYQLGWRWVDLYADPTHGDGANFLTMPSGETKGHCQITIGMKEDDPAYLFGLLCHEVWELAINEQMCSFTPRAFMEQASDVHVFFYNHNQHTEICAKAGFFIWKCFNDFNRAFTRCADHRKRQLTDKTKNKKKKRK